MEGKREECTIRLKLCPEGRMISNPTLTNWLVFLTTYNMPTHHLSILNHECPEEDNEKRSIGSQAQEAGTRNPAFVLLREKPFARARLVCLG